MALTFGAAVTDRVVVTQNASINGLPKMSFLVWAYPTTLTDGRRLWDKKDDAGGYNRFQLSSTGNGYLRFFIQQATSGASGITNEKFTINAWNCAAHTYDDSVSQRVHAYLGSLTSTLAECTWASWDDGSGSRRANNNNNLYIGNDQLVNASFQGRIALVAIWNEVLTQAQFIQQQFQLDRPVAPANCVLFSHLGMGAANAIDWSGYVNNGAITGATLSGHLPLRIFRISVLLPDYINYVISPNNASQDQTVESPSIILPQLAISPNNASQAQSVGAPSVTTDSVIAPANTTADQTVDSPTTTFSAAVVPSNVSQGQSVDSPATVTESVVSPSDVSQDQPVDSPTVVYFAAGETTIIPDSVAQSQIIKSSAMKARFPLWLGAKKDIILQYITGVAIAPNDVSQSQPVASPDVNLSKVAIVPADVTQDQYVDENYVVEDRVLTVQDVQSDSTSESIPYFPENTDLVVADTSHSSTSENVAIVRNIFLNVRYLYDYSTTENVNLVQSGELNLVVQDTQNNSASTNINIAQVHTPVVQDVSQTCTSTNIDLVEHKTLEVQDISSDSSSDIIALTQEHTLSMQWAYATIASTIVALTQEHTLVVKDTSQASTSENINTFDLLVVQNTSHSIASDNITLTVGHILVMQNVNQSISSTNISLAGMLQVLVVASALHVIWSTNIDIQTGERITCDPLRVGLWRSKTRGRRMW